MAVLLVVLLIRDQMDLVQIFQHQGFLPLLQWAGVVVVVTQLGDPLVDRAAELEARVGLDRAAQEHQDKAILVLQLHKITALVVAQVQRVLLPLVDQVIPGH